MMSKKKIPAEMRLWIETVLEVSSICCCLHGRYTEEEGQKLLKLIQSASKRVEAVTGPSPIREQIAALLDEVDQASPKQLKKMLKKGPAMKIRLAYGGVCEPDKKGRSKKKDAKAARKEQQAQEPAKAAEPAEAPTPEAAAVKTAAKRQRTATAAKRRAPAKAKAEPAAKPAAPRAKRAARKPPAAA